MDRVRRLGTANVSYVNPCDYDHRSSRCAHMCKYILRVWHSGLGSQGDVLYGEANVLWERALRLLEFGVAAQTVQLTIGFN